MGYCMNELYLLCGISRQAHFQALARERSLEADKLLYINLMHQIRSMHPGMGLRKMYAQFAPEGIGRDAFIALGLQEGFRLKAFAKPTRTTYAYKGAQYKNLLVDKRFTDVNQVWTSDITYFAFKEQFYYIVLIMDVYSRKIVGYSIADNMRAENNIKALRKALNLRNIQNYNKQLIHHSDRGTQYIAQSYTDLLEDFGIQISMCKNVLENAHIERVNGIIKNDYLKRWHIKDQRQLPKMLKKAVDNYNDRAHQALGNKTPNEFEVHIRAMPIEKRKQLTIFTKNQNSKNSTKQMNIFEQING